MLGFASAIVAYTAWQPLEDFIGFAEDKKGSLFFICVAFSFCCYTSAYMFTKWNKWRWFPMFVASICVSRFIVELLLVVDTDPKPETYEMIDYISFLTTIFIVFNYYIKHRREERLKNPINK